MDTHDKPATHTRRTFLQTAGAATAIAAPYFVPASALGLDGKPAPSERISLGIIGTNGMGQANLRACLQYPDVELTAVCDVWRRRMDPLVAQHKATAIGHTDYRELLSREDVDAVIIATPPHWHTLMAIEAVEAGKDIYLQKPMTLYPDETLAVRNAVNQHNRISQIGTQIHASSNYRRVVEWIRSGRLGPVGVVRTFNVMNQGPNGIGHAPQQDAPSDLDWQRWLGPAPAIEYNSLLAADSYNHCSFWDYSGGWTPGMAPHIIDLPIWALELGVPTVTSCSGGRYMVGGDGDAPDTQEVIWQYPNLTMHWSMSTCNSFAFDFGRGEPARRIGTYFHALNGTLYNDYSMHEVVAEGGLLEDNSSPPQSIEASPGHEREWIDSVKTRKEPSCGVNYHYKVDLALTLANLSYKLGRSVRFDSATEKIVDDDEAVRLARPTYRAPWKFPTQYLS
ncbi:Inositol 2-dehydrogenase [Planctomycetes bacterium CA13]|uniref:Inositol 2-dehydrogenase n=1 Tax=Novipirellula herctigrandis TaxID=2527986 RepID=A0A5C5Z163_9BACT|nr:Inositol 2-dehydrogenase [Planctomycetes bacterium CA13]